MTETMMAMTIPRLRLFGYVLWLLLASLFLAGCQLGLREEFNVESTRVDMIIFFKEDATTDDLRDFDDLMLSDGPLTSELPLVEGIGALTLCATSLEEH